MTLFLEFLVCAYITCFIRLGTEDQEEMMKETSSWWPKLEERVEAKLPNPSFTSYCQTVIQFLQSKHETTESGNKLNSVYPLHNQQLKLQLATNMLFLSKSPI